MKIPPLPEFSYQAIPLSPDDNIHLDVVAYSNPVVLVIEGMAINLKGDLVPFRETRTTTASLTRDNWYFKLGYKSLLSLSVRTESLAIPDGDCFVTVSLVEDITSSIYPVRQILCRGYVASGYNLSYGFTNYAKELTEHNFIENIAVADPAAGAPIIYSCPDYTRLVLQAVSFSLITSATVINRYCYLRVTYGATDPHNVSPYGTQGASTTVRYTFTDSVTQSLSAPFQMSSSASPNFVLTPGSGLYINAHSIQAADQFRDMSIFVKRSTQPF